MAKKAEVIEKNQPEVVEVEVDEGVLRIQVKLAPKYDNVIFLFFNEINGKRVPSFSQSTRLRTVEKIDDGFASMVSAEKVKVGTKVDIRDVATKEVVLTAVIKKVTAPKNKQTK